MKKRYTRILCAALLAALITLTACGSETQRVANSEEFGTLYRIDYTDSAGISSLTPYGWSGLEIKGCALLVPPGSNVFALISGNDTPTISIYDALVYDGDSKYVNKYVKGMGADEWVETALTGSGSSKAITTMTLSASDNASGISTDNGDKTYVAAYVTNDKAYMCVMQVPSAYLTADANTSANSGGSSNAQRLVGAEKDLAIMAKSCYPVALVPKAQ